MSYRLTVLHGNQKPTKTWLNFCRYLKVKVEAVPADDFDRCYNEQCDYWHFADPDPHSFFIDFETEEDDTAFIMRFS